VPEGGPLRVEGDKCAFLTKDAAFPLPIAHGEGKFVTSDADVLGRIKGAGQAVLRYDGDNPNGSVEDIAGICDPTGRVFGLMPHPEAYHHWTNHPDWPRRKEPLRRTGRPLPTASTPGVRIFENAVEYLRAA